MMDRRAQIGRERIGFPFAGDTQGQLVSVATNGAFAESYAYDPLGRRARTTSGTNAVFHLYDGAQCVADADASGNPLRSYTWGLGIDNLLAITVYSLGATNNYYAVKDQLGSVQALVDAAGTVVESYSYDAWGNVLTGGQQSAIGNRYLWQGREYSFATGLYNFHARWYAPEFGRWLSKDPIGLEGGLNLYAFCGDDPVNFRDPMGLKLLLHGNAEERALVLSVLQQFINGLSTDENGYLKREKCSKDNKYDDMISTLINSDSIYGIISGPRADKKLIIGDQFAPDGWGSGTIYWEKSQPKYSDGLFRGYNVQGTLGTTLAHELVHASQNLEKMTGANLDEGNRKLESDAINRANQVYPRMNMPLRYQ